jgi:hypothetical protein
MSDPVPGKSKEDREVDAAVQALQNKVQGIKGSLSSFVGKMEHEPLTWPSVLDSFSATVGHFSTLLKQLTSDKTPPLSNRVIIPLQVSSERDPELEVSHHTHSQGLTCYPLRMSTECDREQSANATP